jgi:Virulence factor BrkB
MPLETKGCPSPRAKPRYRNSRPIRPFSFMMDRQATNDAGEQQDTAKTVAPGLWPALKGAASDWSAHKSAKAGAAIAYYSIFSIGPLIVVVIPLAALFFGRKGVQQEVTQAIRGLLGDKGSEAVNAMLTAAGAPSEGVFASIIGTVTLVFAAIGVVVQFKEALNVVWEVKPKPGGGIWGFTRSYVLSLAGVLTVGFLLLVSMLLTAALSAFARTFGTVLPEPLMQAAGFPGVVRRHQRAVHHDVQVAARRGCRMARRLAGRRGHCRAVRDRQVPDRPLHRQAGPGIDLRRIRVDRRGADLGLLLRADRAVRRGVHACPRPPTRIGSG